MKVYLKVTGGKDIRIVRGYLECVEFNTNLKRLKARLMSHHVQFRAEWCHPVEPDGVLLLQSWVVVTIPEIGDLLDGLQGVTVGTEPEYLGLPAEYLTMIRSHPDNKESSAALLKLLVDEIVPKLTMADAESLSDALDCGFS